jgi:hypothetical protein
MEYIYIVTDTAEYYLKNIQTQNLGYNYLKECVMSGKPDAKWQELIDSYLNRLNAWQRLMLKNPQLLPKKPAPGKKNKADNIYKAMKQAEQALREYEAEKGY